MVINKTLLHARQIAEHLLVHLLPKKSHETL